MPDEFHPDLSELPHYSEWNDSQPISLLDYTTLNLSPDITIGVTKLFFPDFMEYRGGIFRKPGLEKDVLESQRILDDWFEKLGNDITAIEKVANHVHIAQDLLIYPFASLSYTNIAYFGHILAHCWQKALEVKFPDRVFTVSIEKDGEFDDVVIAFWQANTDIE